ncbi:MAG: hypothetical protein VB085_01605 [Peptococcaceae bacterium]|nr:hypothetical protein [Peptococcaceae bacterium]
MDEICLCRKSLVRKEKLSSPQALPENYPPASIALELVNDLSCGLFVRPTVYREAGSPLVHVRFPFSSYGCDEFFSDYGRMLAALDAAWPAAVYGSLPKRETGELKARREEAGISTYKSCVSGKDFDALSDLWLKIKTGDPGEGAVLEEVLKEVDYRKSCIAIPRRYAPYFQDGITCRCQEGAHFCYLSLVGGAGAADYLGCLSLTQKAELWREFLEDSLAALEFEWLWADYRKNKYSLLEWELILEAVTARLGIRVTREDRQLRVTDAAGRLLRSVYPQGGAAEKIFLKILFPMALEK